MTDDPPVLRVVSGGSPSGSELAALTAALAVLAARATDSAGATAPRWNDRAAGLRRPLPRGRGWAWADRG